MRILNTYPLPDAALAAIESLPGVTITTRPEDAAELTLDDLVGVDVLWGELPGGDLAAVPRLRWMARAGAGVEDVDLAGLTAHGSTLTNASGLHASSMGEYCLGAMLFASQHQAARVAAQLR